MGFFTAASSMLGFASRVLPLQLTSCVLIAAAICILIGSARVGRTATPRQFGFGQRSLLAAPQTADSWWLLSRRLWSSPS